MELGLGSSAHSLVLKLTISYTELLLKMLVSYPLRIQLFWQLLTLEIHYLSCATDRSDQLF